MAQLKSLSINGKDLTNSLTQTASATVNLQNVAETITATIKRCGNTCMLFCEGEMNKINNIAAWSSLKLLEFPAGYKPINDFTTTFYCDGQNDDWNKNYFLRAYTNNYNELALITRDNAYVGGGIYTDGNGFWFSATYVTADDWPTT